MSMFHNKVRTSSSYRMHTGRSSEWKENLNLKENLKTGSFQAHCVNIDSLIDFSAHVVCAHYSRRTRIIEAFSPRLRYSSQHRASSSENMSPCVPKANAAI